MTRLALAVLALLIAPALLPMADAQVAPSPPPRGSVWTVFSTVQADVRDNYAVVRVIEDIRNQGPDPEFPFVVRVPDDAFVTGLILERDGQVHEALIKDRAQARQEYEAWKAQEQTGGLVEKARRTSLYSYLINVAEFTNVRATLTYERYLAADRGVYNLSLEAPVSGFGRDLGARFDVTLRSTEGVVSAWGDPTARVRTNGTAQTLTYEVGPRPSDASTPFTASYMLPATEGAGELLATVIDGKGYFAHRFRAPADAEDLPMDLVMVLDVSGSMSGLKMEQMRDAAKQVVQALGPDDRLHLVAFSSDARSPWQGLLTMDAANRRRAAEEIEALFDGGGTNIEGALRRGFSGFAGAGRVCDASASSAQGACGIDWAREDARFPALLFLTDGQPSVGVQSGEELRRIARDANTRGIPVFGIAFGDDADWSLIHGLATDAEGAALRVPPGAGAEVDLRRFMTMLTAPVLRNVEVDYNAGVVAHRAGAPVLFAGSEMLVVGTFDPARGIRGTVTGLSPEGPRSYQFQGEPQGGLAFLPRLAAYQEIRALQEREDASAASATDVARVKELALAHGFVTDHTSLVLTLPPREARPFTAGATAPAGDTASTGTTAPASAPSRSWWPFGGSASSDASSSAPMVATPTSATPNGGAPTSAPAVPGPGVALLLVALAALALARGRRRQER